MAESEKQVRYDLDGHEVITTALMALINQYPRLPDGDEITFSTLEAESGKALFPITGAIIETEDKDILGTTTQICLYPFFVVYRASGLSESRKAAIKEWLDDLGRWLEQQSITANGTSYILEEYPELSGSRRFLSISRQTPAYLDNTNEQVEDWAIYISARYSNEFKTKGSFINGW